MTGGLSRNRYKIIVTISILLFYFILSSIPVSATFSNPSPSDGEDCVFTSLWDYGVNVTLSITWTDTGSQDINFYWSNGTLIGTDINVASGDTASILVHNLSFATTYHWYAKTGDNSEQSSTYTFTTSDVFVVQKNDPNTTPYAWVKSSDNPTIPNSASGWDSTDIEGTTAFYDPVSDKFVIIYSGDSVMDSTKKIGVCYAYNISDLQNPGSSGYDKDPYNPVITETGNLWGLGVLDDREDTGEVKLYGCPDDTTVCKLWINTDGNWSNWTLYGTVISSGVNDGVDVIKLEGIYIMIVGDPSSDNLKLYYSNDGKTGWTADSNNPVILESWWHTDKHCSTPQLFWINTTNSSRVYCSLEVGDGAGHYMGAIAYCNYSDLVDGDHTSTWYPLNNPNEYAVGDDVNHQSWECTTTLGTCEHKTVYFPRKDPYHLYLFFENQCSDHSQVGTAYTTVYGILNNNQSSNTNTVPQLQSINNQLNNTNLPLGHRYFNWTKVDGATKYELQIANDSSFTDVFVDLDNIYEGSPLESMAGGNYEEKGDYVEFSLPYAYNITFTGKHYYRVRAFV